METTVLTLSDLYPSGALTMTQAIAADLLLLEPHDTAATILMKSLGSGVSARVPFRDPGPFASPLDRQVAVVRWLDSLLANRVSA